MYSLSFHEKIKHGTTEFPMAYYYVNSSHPRYVMNIHWHKEWELIRILEGNIKIYADEQIIYAQKGDLVLLKDSTLHSGLPNDCVYECLVFDLHKLDFCKKYLPSIYRLYHLPDIHYISGKHPELYNITDKLLSVFSSKNTEKINTYELSAICYLGLFFNYINENKLYSVTENDSLSNTNHIDCIKQVLEHIETNFQYHISLTQLADIANMNPNYFCQIFKEIIHQTPIEYLNLYRIEHSTLLLLTTDMSVMDICFECGFIDCSYFIRVFKKNKGITPSKYRKSYSNTN